MKKHRVRLFVIVQLAMIGAVFIFGQVIRANMKKCGIEKIRTIEELDQMEIALGSILKEETDYSFIDYQEDYVNDFDMASIIAVVEPTGNILPYYYTWKQEVIVKKIVKGDPSLINQTIQICDPSKVAVNKIVMDRVAYHDIVNIMRPNNQYLAFFNPLELNDYLDETLYRYANTYFSYFNLNAENKIPEFNLKEIDKKYLNEIKDVEFMTSSTTTYANLIQIKEKVVSKYLDK